MKSVEGVHGNSIALDYRREKLPAKVAVFLAHRVLDVLCVASFMLGSYLLVGAALDKVLHLIHWI